MKSILFRLDLRLELLSLYECKGLSNLLRTWSFAFPAEEIYNLNNYLINNLFNNLLYFN